MPRRPEMLMAMVVLGTILALGPVAFTKTIQAELEQLGYHCTAEEALSAQPGARFDAVALVMRPFAAAGTVEAVRRACSAPVLLVGTPQTVIALEGADRPDDFISPAHSPAELHARLLRLMRAAPAPPPPPSPPARDALRAGDLVIDRAAFRVSVKGELVDLALREYQLLAFLAANPGRAFSREELLARVWGGDYLGGTRTVDVHVQRLREKLAACGQEMLSTVRGVGYRFELPAESQ